MTETTIYGKANLESYFNTEFTRLVNCFIQQGFVMDCQFAGYSDGSIARASMTDGDGWYQIRIDNQYDMPWNYYQIRILYFDASYDRTTLWEKDGITVYAQYWYEFKFNRVFCCDLKQIEAMCELGRSRRPELLNPYERGWKDINYNVDTILNIVKKYPGYKRTKAEDIKKVRRNYTFGKACYAIYFNRKVSKKAATSIFIDPWMVRI